MEEEKNKRREFDLKEKDILIQENLLRFAETLQMQEQLKAKDDAEAVVVKEKIADKQSEIKEMDKRLRLLSKYHAHIENKIERMRPFGKFITSLQ
jgi:predicted transcriptional regulator